MKDFAVHHVPAGLSYGSFMAQWEARLGQSLKGLDRQQRRFLYYARYNWARAAAVHAAYQPSEALRRAVRALPTERWIVLTEDWCVDSAYSLPVIAEAAACAPNITLEILARDEHPEVMDRYLTGESRSIPKLVAFDAEGREQFRWGPRPAPVQRLREEMQARGLPAAEVSAAVVARYEEGAWRHVEDELLALIEAGG